MATPTKNAIILGIVFVFVGLIKAMCDRWQRELKAIGVPTKKEHPFDHMFVMWLVCQLLQLLLLPLWRAIEKNVCGLGRFRHGEVQPKGKRYLQPKPEPNLLNRPDELDGNGHIGAPVADAAHAINNDEDDGGGVINEAGEGERNRLIEDRPRNNRKNQKPSALIYFPAAFFAQAHVLLLYFGLQLTYGSSFIMLKGTVAFFTALLSMAFLAKPLACYVWFGVVVATLGFGVSGISDYIHKPKGGYEKYGIAAGDLLIVMAQIMFATKIIYEEKFIRKHSIHPMVFLGKEAIYGIFMAMLFFLVFQFVDAVQYSTLPNGRLEDIVDAAYQLYNSWQAVLAVIGSLLTYIVFTYLGMFLIRDQGALPRIMIETFVWAIYWAICLGLHWENFFIAQVPGLCVIAIGSLIYSHILLIPFVSRRDHMDHGGAPLFPPQQNLNPPNENRAAVDGNGHLPDEVEDDDVLPIGGDGAAHVEIHHDGNGAGPMLGDDDHLIEA